MAYKFKFSLQQIVSPDSLETLRLANRPVDLATFQNIFQRYFAEELEILKILGVSADSGSKKFFDPFGAQTYVVDDFGNIGEHCLAVAGCAMFISKVIGEDLTLGSKIAKEAVKRAILHDSLKPWEVFLARAFRNNQITREEYYLESIFDRTIDVLTSLGLSLADSETLVRDYGSECDVRECFGYFLRVQSDGEVVLGEGDLVKKIVHLADNMTCSILPTIGSRSRHYFLTTSERLILSEADKRYPWALKAGIGVSKENVISHTSDQELGSEKLRIIYNIHEALIALSHVIAQELVPTSTNPDVTIKTRVLKALEHC